MTGRDIAAIVRLYPTRDGGKSRPIRPGYRCPCFVRPDKAPGGWDVRIEFDGPPLEPGGERRVRLRFLISKGEAAIVRAGRFYLWELRFVGEGEIVA